MGDTASLTDLVVLVPGFLGFDRLPGLDYFEAGFFDAFRVKLLQSSKGFDVTRVDTEPTGSLVARQERLLRQLQEQLERSPNARLHLIGHSTGGVDARLLVAEQPLAFSSWLDMSRKLSVSAEQVRERIATLIGLAAPHRGTWLVNHPDVRDLRDNQWAVLKHLFVEPGLVPSLLGDVTTARLLVKGLFNVTEVKSFVDEIVNSRELIHDLRPEVITTPGDLSGEAGDRDATQAPSDVPGVRLRSVVVMTAKPMQDPFTRILQQVRTDRALYEWLRKRCEQYGSTPPDYGKLSAADRAKDQQAINRIQQALSTDRAIVSQGVVLRGVDDRVSDAIVTAARQLFDPSDDEELLAVVVADHLDVIGHYDRRRFPCSRFERAGLIKSGSNFGDRQRDMLLDRLVGEVFRSAASQQNSAA